MKIHVDLDACVGAGQCALVAGDIFDQDDAGIVIVINDEPKPEQEAQTLRAVSLCPARAITVS